MSGWMSHFRGRKDPRSTTREAIVTLRQQLQILENREEYILKKIDEDLKKAKANIISNKPAAAAALRIKKAHETEFERLSGIRVILEAQVNAIETANFNVGIMEATKKGADLDARRTIHGGLTIDIADATMDSIEEQIELAIEIGKTMDINCNPMNVGPETDEEDLKIQLAELSAEIPEERVPSHIHSVAELAMESRKAADRETEEERELRELQAQLA